LRAGLLEKSNRRIFSGTITRSKSKKNSSKHISLLALELEEDIIQDISGLNSEEIINKIPCDHFAISAIPEFIDEGYNLSSIDEITEPNNADEALRSPVWKKSMDEEYVALLNKKTWELVIPPENVNIVGNKWVYLCKKDQDGRVIRAKSCLVAQGFTQTFGVDYYETYSPVVCLASLQTIL